MVDHRLIKQLVQSLHETSPRISYSVDNPPLQQDSMSMVPLIQEQHLLPQSLQILTPSLGLSLITRVLVTYLLPPLVASRSLRFKTTALSLIVHTPLQAVFSMATQTAPLA